MKALDWSNLLNHKLILLYIIHQLPGKFSREDLVSFVLANGLMNYFLVNQYSLDLMEAGLVEDYEGKLSPSSQGDQALHFFVESLSEDLQAKLDGLLERAWEEVKKKESIQTDLEALETGGYQAQMKISEKGQDLLYLSLHVNNKEEGERILDAFQRRPGETYEKILEFVHQDEQL